MKYIIDTSAIIDAIDSWYPPEVFPGLWTDVGALIEEGRLISSEMVYEELKKKDDQDAFAWAEDHKVMFVLIDTEIQLEVRSILEEHQKLVKAEKHRSSADAFVIALARVENGVVVTSEKRRGNLDRPMIPDVCDYLGIETIGFLEILRRERWRYG